MVWSGPSLLGAAPVSVSSRFGAAVSMLTCFALRWQRRAPGPAIWMFALKSCQLGLSAARDASVLAAILRRASLTASALAAPAAQHWSWLRQWPELNVHCVWALCPVLLRVRVRVRVCAVALLDRSWPRQWLRVRPGCATGPASVLAAPVAPVVNMRRGPVRESVQHAGFHAIRPESALSSSRFTAYVPC